MKIPLDSFFRGTKPGAHIIVDGTHYDVLDVTDDVMIVNPRDLAQDVDLGNRSMRALARINRRIV